MKNSSLLRRISAQFTVSGSFAQAFALGTYALVLTPLLISALLLSALLPSALFPSPVRADERRGQVSSRPCPYSCATQGIPKIDCRDWRNGNTCFIEDLRYPAAGDGSGIGGSGIGGSSNGSGDFIGGSGANDSQFGGRGNGGSWNTGPRRPSAPPPPGGWGNRPGVNPNSGPLGENDWIGAGGTGVGECQNLRVGDVAPPRIYLGRVTPVGGPFSGRVRVQGTVEGVCLSDAGIFDGGRKVETISVRAQRRLQRYDFDVQVNAARSAELRAYNTAGDSDVVEVRPPNPGYGNGPWGGYDNGYGNYPNTNQGGGWGG